jgi:hypothetical protein
MFGTLRIVRAKRETMTGSTEAEGVKLKIGELIQINPLTVQTIRTETN